MEPLINPPEVQPFPGWNMYRKAKWIRVSAMLSYLRCPRLYFYQYGIGLVPLEPRLALHFGEAIHAAIGWLLGHENDFTGSMVAFDKVWKPEWEAMRETKEGFNRNRTVAQKMIFHWINVHSGNKAIWTPVPPPRANTGMVPTETQSDYEMPFAVDLGIPGAPMLVGRIDAMCKHRDTGDLWLWELKTGSKFTWYMLPQCFQSNANNTQALMYNLACHLMGTRTRGTMAELLLANEKQQDSQTIPMYVQPFQLDDMLKLLRWKVSELMMFQERGEFPKDLSACNTYSKYGSPGFTCDFARLCGTPDWTIFKDLYKIQDDRPFYIQPMVEGKEISK